MKTTRISNVSTYLSLNFASIPSQAKDIKKEINFSEQKFMPFYNLRKIGDTSIFQGNTKNRKYFEGWYFKMVSEDELSIFSVIPGISLSRDGKKKHAFVQIIDGITAKTSYYSFPIEDFSFSKKEFAIKIGVNYFSKNMIILDLKDNESNVSGTIEMCNHVDYTSGKFMTPGIMGWYRFVPFMQCYHGVVSITHKLIGRLIVNNEMYDFNNGKGYIEKDWGTSMPSAWIWMQSNNFNDSNSSFMLSIADIPWLGKSFTGFLGFFYHNNQIHHFATYRRTKLQLEIADSNFLKITIENGKNTFILNVRSKNAGMLKAPVEGSMDRRIPESIDATLEITMIDKKGRIVYIDSTTIAGLEMVGDYKRFHGLIK